MSRKTVALTAVAVAAGLVAAKPVRRAASLAFLYATGTVVRDERPAGSRDA
ncbi:hypothetical protein [Actinocorallia sp. A-T 12471]|uniref:hypothetical protein n=1 Tax=Actinocorallia sp. A-T 12471 TaxID=3089813 RepID=UPI0029D058D0|nr:hypothetical protein [Actinocorallia sp. A-T 12471]MDX6741076.1 hypothetical protein [Actinocorallia sp. A-T 12471]